jgi:hypothetical protein
MTSVLRELPLSYAVLSEGCPCGSVSAVHEPSPVGPAHHASSGPAGPSARATSPRRSRESSALRVRLHLRPGQRARSSSPRSTVTASSAWAIATTPTGRSDSKPCNPRCRTRLGTATASLRPQSERRVAHPLCRLGGPRPSEAGRWDVEPTAKGAAIAVRSHHRARLGGPDRPGRRVRARPEHLMVDAATGRPQHPPRDAGGHSDVDASIHWRMLASDGGGRALQSNVS